jgi:murein L,D-transpeptidase YafK
VGQVRTYSSRHVKWGFSLAVAMVFVLVLWTHLCAADSRSRPALDSGLVPAILLHRPEKGSEYVILVDKSAQKVFVYSWHDLSRPLRIYACSTGENPGPKTRQNDKRTPEGIYFFTHSYLKKDLSPIYGVRAFPIDYPSPMDRKEGNGGYGIWFHGTDKPLVPNDSNGCIVLENGNIEEMASYITLNDTPVVICAKIEMKDRDKVEKEKREMLKIIETWRRDWEGENIERYMSRYGKSFTLDGRNWSQYKAYKTMLAERYAQIMVDVENVWLLKHGGTVLAKFDQNYRTERLQSRGEKRLYFSQNSKEWRIVGEFFKKKELKRGPPKEPYFGLKEEIRRFVSSWQEAWEGKDLKGYIQCYDTAFVSRGMDLGAWKTHRERLNRKQRFLNINIADLNIQPISSREAKVRFRQRYQADTYEDYGLKSLLVVKKGQDWRIKKEEWQPLQGN